MGTLSRTTDGRGADGSGTVSDGRAAANRSLKGKSLKARAGLAATTASVRASVRANAEANFFLVIGAHQLALGGLRCCERAIVLSQGRPLPAVDRAEIAGCHERRNASPAHTSWAIWAGGGPWSAAFRYHFAAAARNERIGAARRDQALSPSARHRRRDRRSRESGRLSMWRRFLSREV